MITTLDELKVTTSLGEVELADLYARQEKNVLIGEIKSSGVYSEKYEGTAQALFKSEKEFLYENFGLLQVIKAIDKFCNNPELFEIGLTPGGFDIYPVLVVNEKIFQTPIIPRIFQSKLSDELKKIQVERNKIHPITLIHIADLETMKDALKEGNVSLWEILQANYADALWPRPLQITLSRKKINPKYTLEFAHFAGFPKE